MYSLDKLALAFSPWVGIATARNLMHQFGSPGEVFKANKKALKEVSGLRDRAVDAIVAKEGFKRAEEELKFIEKYKIQAMFFTDEEYPRRLKHCADAPLIIYFKGNIDLNATKVVSIVGTRNASSYGKEICSQLVAELKSHNCLVVSGLAYGVDVISHKACVKESIPTVGVLGHGLDRIYPAAHRAVAEKMVENGGLLAEYPSGTNPDRENFPKRNRIIAGMSDATIVVEAGIKGGALITAEIANSYNRDVFAYPGRINDEYSAGCNYLIKTNRAHLTSSIKDIEYIMDWAAAVAKKETTQISLKLNLSPEEKKITDVLEQKGTLGIDELALSVKVQQSKLAITILGLEMQGILIALPGKRYKLSY